MLLSWKYLSEREPREKMVRSNIKYGKLSFFFPSVSYQPPVFSTTHTLPVTLGSHCVFSLACEDFPLHARYTWGVHATQ